MKRKEVINDKNKNIFIKNYKYKKKASFKRFFKIEKERAKNNFVMGKMLERDFPNLNFMKVLKYEKINYSPTYIKTRLILEDVNKTYNGNYEHLFDYLVKCKDKEKILKVMDRWFEVENNFIDKGYYYLDFHLGNIMIDENKVNNRYVIIDFDEFIKSKFSIRKKLYIKKSFRSFSVSIKFLLRKIDFSYEDKKEIIDKLRKIADFYGIKPRKEDLELTKKILGE